MTFSAFSGSSVEQILESLGHLPADNAWAQETLKLLNGNSPLSLKIIFEQIRRAKSMTLREAFIEDFRITQK